MAPFPQLARAVWSRGALNIRALLGGVGLAVFAFGTRAAEPHPPVHPDVGQRYVPADVDWLNPVYVATFERPADLSNWKLEGGTRMGIADGRLVLESTLNGPELKDTSNHLGCWLTQELPADFLLGFQIRPLDRRTGLNIVFFSARGIHGESTFDPVLQPRTGLFAEYHSGDLNNYHISYLAGERGTANVRKNAGFRWVATGKDLVVLAPADAFQIVRLYKRGGRIRLTVDDVIEAACDDDGKAYGSVWNHSGWMGSGKWPTPGAVSTITFKCSL